MADRTNREPYPSAYSGGRLERLVRDKYESAEVIAPRFYGTSTPYQTLVVETPLVGDLSFLCATIVDESTHNSLSDMSLLSESNVLIGDTFFQDAFGLEELVRSLLPQADSSAIQTAATPVEPDELIARIYRAIDSSNAIVYRGSLVSPTTKQLANLPTLIKGLAKIGAKDFRCGLLRLGMCIVVVGVAGGASAVAGAMAARKMIAIGSEALEFLKEAPSKAQQKKAVPIHLD